MLFSACADTNDQSIGPSVLGCRGDFDFTVKFEQLFFSLLPSAIFTVASLWRASLLIRRPTIVGAPVLRLAKMGALMSYASLECSLLLLVAIRLVDVTNFAIASSALRLVAAFCMMFLSYLDHSKSPRPSILMSAYLFLSLLFDIVQARTYWLATSTRPEKAFSTIFTAALAMKVVILLLEARRKTRWVNWDSKNHSPEETSGIYSLGVYFWLNRLFLNGYSKVLAIKDLYPLDDNLAAQRVSERFVRYLDDEKLRSDKFGLLKVLGRTLAGPLLLPIPARLALTAFSFCQPMFISSLLQRLSQTETAFPDNISYGFIGASICIYSGIAISTAFYWYLHLRTLYMARACLITAIYTKTTEARKSGDDENAPLTLMSSDIERIYIGFKALHESWANFIEVGLAGWLLYGYLGPAFVAPIVLIAVCSVGIVVMLQYMGEGQKKWMKEVERRVGLTSGVIANMKNIKISGLTLPIAHFVEKLRRDELRASSRFRKMTLVCATFAYLPILISPALTFGVAQRSLDPARLFTSMSYLLLMTTPLISLFQALPLLAAGFACVGRIQTYLGSEKREDFRQVVTEIRDTEKPTTSLVSATPAITIKNGHFGWEPDKKVLSNVDIEVPSGSLTMIVGPVASGKSSLCRALLGEIPYSQGTVTVATGSPRVGYCDQTPFLLNGSIRENIVGYSPFNADRYAEVVGATMLRVDFESLPQSDETTVGSNGITLSGGQKQRVSLARCLYLQADLLILDDIFSGLDADTEDQVFQRVFGVNGILRRRQTTVVLCTHSVRHLPAADHVIALGSDGTVIEQGNFSDLIANQSYVHSLGVKSSASETGSEAESGVSIAEPQLSLLREISTLPSAAERGDEGRLQSDRKAYRVYFKSLGAPLATSIFFFGLCWGALYNFPTVWLSYWSEDSAAANPSHSFGYYAGIYAGLEVSALLSLMAFGTLIYVTSIKRVGISLHHDALQTLIHAPLRFFALTDQGVITNLFSQDLGLIDNELPSAFLNTIFSVFISMGQAAVIASSSPYLAISYPFLVYTLYAIQKFYLRTSRQLRLLDLEAKSPLYTHFLDTAKGIVTFRAFGFTKESREKNARLLDTSQRPAYLLSMIQQWLSLVLNIVVAITAVMLTSLAVRLRSNSGFTGASLVTLMAFGNVLSDIISSYTLLETSLGAITRLKSFDKTAKTEDQDDETIVPPEEWPQRGEISLRGVSATYNTDEEPTETPTLALKNIDLQIRAGEKVAICGRTGSGKSSLIALLLKLLDPVQGTTAAAADGGISIDGTLLGRVDRSSLRQRVIAIPQDTVFLPDGSTFGENLDPLGVAAAADAQAVLEAVGLWSFVEERGGIGAGMVAGTLSQGQRQLFSLARAVLRRRERARALLGPGGAGREDGGVLLLDEVSSSVDGETERAMQRTIRTEFAAYTVVAVSHRLEMVADYDRVVVMDRGEIIEVGDPARLRQQPGTRFGELWALSGNGGR
ncbi:ABC multidrug transporter [Durotheca rogersii]|uniref:ABC multidrug transporter n=1 Tax=Durotheca rogersii TaxID=419775 RepID=UPI00221FDB0B|nr:ABC multidrug transporter [Durotheca rogersii]KAI5861411.1 ABC multidrug transporter [Durotheca rogersii]